MAAGRCNIGKAQMAERRFAAVFSPEKIYLAITFSSSYLTIYLFYGDNRNA
jgi:hypothetical protein